MNKKILLVGGGGHCHSVLDCLLRLDEYSDIGIVDYDLSANVYGIPVVGNDNDLHKLMEAGWNNAFVTVGSIGATDVRHKLYNELKEQGFFIPTIVDPSAVIAKEIELGEGTFVGKGAIINSGSRIGNCSIINTGSIVEHDCIIGEFCHISIGVSLCGQVAIGADTHIGANSVVRQCIRIGHNSLIGIGSVVVRDIPDDSKGYGNPCRVVG